MKLISQPSRETRQMVQCLELYYKQGRSQKDIAVALGVSAATVSRLLKRAMDDGLVRVELDLPRTEELETGLVQTYGLREAVVVASGGRGGRRLLREGRRERHAHRAVVRAHALSHDPLAARASLARSRALSAVGREHAQARRHLRQHARRHDGGQVPAARAGLRSARAAPA